MPKRSLGDNVANQQDFSVVAWCLHDVKRTVDNFRWLFAESAETGEAGGAKKAKKAKKANHGISS